MIEVNLIQEDVYKEYNLARDGRWTCNKKEELQVSR